MVVGAGFTGLWAALQAKEDDPSLEVVVIDAGRVADHASGRNGGFCSSSLTHGLDNGVARFPRDMGRIEKVADDNFAAIAATIDRYGIDCDWRPVGALGVATAAHLVDELHDAVELGRRFGHDVEFLDRDAVRDQLDSPTYHAGVWQRSGEALVDPARLAWGLADAARSLGVVVHERTPMIDLERDGAGIAVRTASGTIRAGTVVLGTNAFRSPVRAINRTVAPVYDYVLATEPLSEEQLRLLRWDLSVGVSDAGNQFHYYRITPDRRILWGGYDAIYHYGRGIDPDFEDRAATYQTLARNFARTFPQLAGVRFTHRWAGVIDTSTRYCAMFGRAHRGRTAYALGFTGLGVGASRFAADVMLDLLEGVSTERTRLKMVRRKPIPFPPEPVAYLGIQTTRFFLAREDRTGRRGAWLRLLDRLGMGFDS